MPPGNPQSPKSFPILILLVLIIALWNRYNIIIPILQIRKLSLREAKWDAQGDPAGQQQKEPSCKARQSGSRVNVPNHCAGRPCKCHLKSSQSTLDPHFVLPDIPKLTFYLAASVSKSRDFTQKLDFWILLTNQNAYFLAQPHCEWKRRSQVGHWHTTLIGDPCPAPWGLTWRPWPTCLTDEDAEPERGWGTWPRPRSSE